MEKFQLFRLQSMGKRLVRGIRPEEWIFVSLWALVVLLCVGNGYGFNFKSVFSHYFRFFAVYALIMICVSRFLFAGADKWSPQTKIGSGVKRFLFGQEGGAENTVRTDLELVRGLMLLFLNLTMYSNLKGRIPALNPIVGDDFFIAADALIFGEHSAIWLETYTRERPEFAAWLADVYHHGYIWMVILLWIAYTRRDGKALRWIFGATILTYITAILVTLAYPSYGPFFLEPERLSWVNTTRSGFAQNSLRFHYEANQLKLKAGEILRAKAFLGIAAFPSLHIGHMVIMTSIAFRLLPLYGVWMIGVTLVTWVATVAFGWHYWVDAIGGAALAIACTELIRWIIRRAPEPAHSMDAVATSDLPLAIEG